MALSALMPFLLLGSIVFPHVSAQPVSRLGAAIPAHQVNRQNSGSESHMVIDDIFRHFEPLKLQSSTGRKVFLDLGSRRGDFFAKFHTLDFFNDFEWVLFECNNRRIPELAQLVDEAQTRGVRVNFIDEAVWIENTTLTFHVDDDEENADHGSSLFEDHAMVHEDGIQVQVPAINFSDFLARNFRPEDTVIVRCDIEGAEYEVLKSLIVAGTARLVDYMDVEWHAMLSPSLHHLKQADTVLPWLLEGFGTRVKGSDYYYEVQCSSEGPGGAQVCQNTKWMKGRKRASGPGATQ